MKRIKYFFLRWDGIWALPMVIALFVFGALFGQQLFGLWFIPMPLDDLHSALEASIILIAANTLALLGLRLNFNALYKYYLGEGKNDFKNLKSWQKLLLVLFVYVLFFSAFIVLWLKIVSGVHILPS